MASNPMQRKARNSFLLGILVTLVIAGIIIAFLLIQLKNYREKESVEKANSVKIYVLSQNVKSGQVITTDMYKTQTINKTLVPSNAVGNLSIIENYALTDKEGNDIITEYKNNNATLYVVRNGSKLELKEEETGSYYVETNGNKEYIELVEAPLIAKVDMYKNTVITVDMISKSDEKTTADLREVEYNMLVLPSQLETGEYVDIRLSLPSGQDYIVVSKKQVTIPTIGDVDSEDTVVFKMTESEIIALNNAIVDAYRVMGSELKVVKYAEAGIQEAAVPTYIPSSAVMSLIDKNPNIIQEARNGLVSRYNSDVNGSGTNARHAIDSSIMNSGAEGEENLRTKVQESITKTKETRKQYLESLND